MQKAGTTDRSNRLTEQTGLKSKKIVEIENAYLLTSGKEQQKLISSALQDLAELKKELQSIR